MLSTLTYAYLQEVAAAAADAYYPNVESVAKDNAGNDENSQHELVAHDTSSIIKMVIFSHSYSNSKQPGFALLTLLMRKSQHMIKWMPCGISLHLTQM